ncbi:MAG: N-acetylneuraminate synthase family protein, partial [Lachnospiraceae bacterium]|nr:N-acetylneuraminate synthase family protein [Lachnospiraceae bacterium]
FRKVKEYCDQLGIAFLSTADEEESLDFLVSLGIPCIKIGSGDIGNLRFLRYAGGKRLPVILSTGMSTLSDIDLSLNALRAGGAEDITLLHCTTSYPCRYADVNLRAMVTLRDAFHLPVGYSDHTIGNIVSVSALALGARVIEKHFTLDKEMKGPDHKASASPEELKSLVDDIRNIEQALGDGRKEPTETERGIMPVVVKRIVAKQLIPEGKILSAEDICVKRNDKGLEAKYTELLIGTRAGKEYLPDEPIELV